MPKPKLFYICKTFIACTIFLNGHDARPDEPPAPAMDFPTLSSSVNFPSSISPSATTYPATSTSYQPVFLSTDASATSFQSANTFPSSINADSTNSNSAILGEVLTSSSSDFATTSFSPIPDFSSSIPNSYLASANSFSNTGLSSLNTDTPSASSTPSRLPTDLPPREAFSLNPFAKAALSLPSLQKYLDLQISGIEASIIFYKIAHKVLIDYANPQPEFLADEISQAAAKINILTLPIYFQTMENAVQDFLLFKGVKVTPMLPITYSMIVDYYVTSSNVNSAESLYKAFSEAFVYFITAIGFPVETEADNLAHFFSSELILVAQ